ncbi:carbohydrate ABC transporter permease [Paenibacillus sp.]|uniref:carbohydrate ABC transporter permease n=1 Tax=Paenibacillus sp. TaxID=58172 RepID=UPI002D579543|nr:carbohydrate ABC transporter permease [Paenibacillus sp.]HZG55028.1 carbohydrate ABC transporter permease [Paenibacillus sp.]
MRNMKIQPFDLFNAIVLLAVSAICLLPFLHLVSLSVSDGMRVFFGEVYFWPKSFNLEVYKYIFNNPHLNITSGIWNSVRYAVVGTVVALALTYMTAYALSRKRLRYRYAIMFVFLLTMILDAGIIPGYLINKTLGLVDSFWVMVVPGAVNVFFLIITRTFLEAIPDELEESAFMDGANDFQIMSYIYLPVSKPVLAVVGLFTAIAIWNSFLTPLIYLMDSKMFPIQLIIYKMVIISGDTVFENTVMNGYHVTPKNIRPAAVMLAMIPILFVYPFAQKYFTKGFLVGSIKG